MRGYSIALSLMLCLTSVAASADPLNNAPTPCTAEDDAFSQKHGYGRADTAYRWGLKIQAALRDKDLEALFAMVDGELEYGPKKAWALQQDFETLFDPSLVEYMTSKQPTCRPLEWRGYIISKGLIWYVPDDDNANIKSIWTSLSEGVTPGDPNWLNPHW